MSHNRWLGASLAVALAVLQLFSPAGAYAQVVVDPSAVTATIWYVDGNNGSDSNQCSASAAPCRTIQAAIDRAASGDTILVAGSANGIVYTFAAAGACTDRFGATVVACVYGNKKLNIHGGYTSGSFASYAPAQNLAIIDGQGRSHGVYANGSGTTLDIRGFTVRNGYGTGIPKRSGESSYFGFGGGMLVESAGAVTLHDMVFDSNRAVGGDRTSGEGGAGAGGAVALLDTTGTLQNVRFVNNTAQGGNGAERGGYAQGGALFTFETTMTGSNLWFEGNIARAGNTSGPGRAPDFQRGDGLGGGACFETGSIITLNGVTARANKAYGGNSATYAGGAFGGGLFGENAQITIDGADIVGNLAQGGNAENGWMASGGGIMTIHSTLSVNRAHVLANTAQGGNGSRGDYGSPNGGGITVSYVSGTLPSRFTLSNSIVAGNRAASGQGKAIGGGGGGVWIQATDATLDHATFANNTLSDTGIVGQGILLLNTGDRGSNVTVRSSLITGHSSGIGSAVEVFPKTTVTFAGGLFAGNTWNTSRDNPNMGNSVGTVNGQNTMGIADPLYIAPSDNDFHIQSTSPARDKAVGSQQKVDIDNEPRDATPDFGADEAAGEPQGLPNDRVLLFLPRITR